MNTHNVKAAEKTSLATSSMMIRQNKMKTISSITSNPCTPLQKTEDGPSTDSYSAKLAVVYCICTRTFHWYSPQREKCTKQATSFGPVYCLQPPCFAGSAGAVVTPLKTTHFSSVPLVFVLSWLVVILHPASVIPTSHTTKNTNMKLC